MPELSLGHAYRPGEPVLDSLYLDAASDPCREVETGNVVPLLHLVLLIGLSIVLPLVRENSSSPSCVVPPHAR